MSKPAAIGIDVGGTKTLCVLVDRHCRIIDEVKFKTAPGEGRARFTRTLLQAVKALAVEARSKRLSVVGAGVGCAGLPDRKGVRIKTSPNLLCLEDYPIGKYLKQTLRTRVIIGNDVQLGIHAEHQLGAATNCKNVLGVFFGTGVGGAAIINGELYLGTSGMGGQVGGLLAQPVGGPKAALSHGILDRIASKAAIAGEALVMAVKDWAPYLHRKVGSDLSLVSWSMLAKAIRRGDDRVEDMLRARMRVVGITLSNVVNFMNPEVVVLGGGAMEEMPQLVLEEVDAGLREYLTPEVGAVVKVKPAKLKTAAVALGAAHEALRAGQKNNGR